MNGRAPVFVAGAASLLVELAFLRYLPGQIRVLGYFTNFVLLAAFVGLGIGMMTARTFPKLEKLRWCGPFAFALLVAFASYGRTLGILASKDEVLFLEYHTRVTRVPLYPFLAAAYLVIALGFVPLGNWIGRTLAGDRPLERYAWNVGGSLAGIAMFAALSASSAPPSVWMGAAALVLAFSLVDAPWLWRTGAGIALAAGVIGASIATRDATWSPYQKITVAHLKVHETHGLVQEWDLPKLSAEERARTKPLPEEEGFVVRVNDDSYQTPLDLRPAAVARHPSLAPMRLQYDLPYAARPPGKVLVLGAGTGNDVAAALRAGATRVDAVEIDPAILALGKRHPEHPYDDSRVVAHVTDARTFLARSEARWDTIVYGLLDSHILMSSMSNVRLDSYVFTTESFAVARTRLEPGGIVVVSHAVGTPWFVKRMRASLARAFERPPVLVSEQVRHPLGFVYAAGDLVAPGRPIEDPDDVLSDDWPFVYLRSRTIPREYLIAIALVAIASLGLVRVAAGKKLAGFDLHFFALGAGFLLLETRGLAVLALVVGSTWEVTSAVFAGVLVMALGATAIAHRLGAAKVSRLHVQSAYVMLGAALALQIALPASVLADFPFFARAVLGAILVSLPLLASGVVFATSLAKAGDASLALASNLLGALAGGLTEYLSMVVGFRVLVLLAALFYALSYAAGARYRAS